MFDAAFSCILIVCHSCTLHIVLKMPNQLETIGCARLIVRGHPLPFFLVDVVDVHGAYGAYGCIWCILGQVCASYFVSIELTQLTQLTHSTRLAPGTSFASIGRWGSCEPCQQKLLQLLAAKRSKQTQVPIDWSYLRTYHTWGYLNFPLLHNLPKLVIETDQPSAAMPSSLASTKSTVWICLVLNQVKYHQIPIYFLFCLVLQPSSQLVGFKASNVQFGEVWWGQYVYVYVYMYICTY